MFVRRYAGVIVNRDDKTRQEACEIAETIALACQGDNHLWQNPLFNSRAELSALMRHGFPTLVAQNHGDMTWKKFFSKHLCERSAVFFCKAPACDVFCDRPVCFGPEEAAGLTTPVSVGAAMGGETPRV